MKTSARRTRTLTSLILIALGMGPSLPARAQTGCSPQLLVGGGHRPPEALTEWMKGAAGSQTSMLEVVVIAWASGEPQESFEAIRAELLLAGAAMNVTASLSAPRNDRDAAEFLSLLANAGAVWFTGGDQNRIADALDHFPSVSNELRSRQRAGTLAIGGTSAGTAIQSKWIFTGDEDLTRIDPAGIHLRAGLGLLPDFVLVDQHFLRRQRQNRLISALLAGAAEIGLGIDEDNALLVRDCTHATPFGTSPLSVYRTSPSSPDRVILDLVRPGTVTDLTN